MVPYQVRTFIGIFSVDENKKVISFKPFPKDPIAVASKLMEKAESNPHEIESFVKENLLKYAIEYKFVKNQIEFNQF